VTAHSRKPWGQSQFGWGGGGKLKSGGKDWAASCQRRLRENKSERRHLPSGPEWGKKIGGLY